MMTDNTNNASGTTTCMTEDAGGAGGEGDAGKHVEGVEGSVETLEGCKEVLDVLSASNTVQRRPSSKKKKKGKDKADKEKTKDKPDKKKGKKKSKGDSMSTAGSCPDADVDAIADGLALLSEATDAERKRFLEAYRGNLEKSEGGLQAYLRWRGDSLPIDASKPDFGRGINQFIHFVKTEEGEYVRTKNSNARILWIWGAMYDPELDVEDYVMSTAQFLDKELDRKSSEKIVVVVDGRPGTGDLFVNPDAWAIVGFAKKCSSLFSAHFPERLHQVVLFPMPWYARMIWAAVKPFLDARTAQKVVMMNGKVAADAPLPNCMWEFIDKEQVPTPPTNVGTGDGIEVAGQVEGVPSKDGMDADAEVDVISGGDAQTPESIAVM